mmetsp:Transcript_2956/g.7163  ORF Transcript_2956/g.7163 Transcript_2956/m.7163 type:complete len:484 (-) Transcript_2956:278-1729(-)
MRVNTAAILGGRVAVSPRSIAASTRKRNGFELRQACQDQAVQDLLHRSEHLSCSALRSSFMEMEETYGESLCEALQGSSVPRLVDATVSRLQLSRTAAEGSITMPPLFMGPAARQRSELSACTTDFAEVEEHSATLVCGTLFPSGATQVGRDALKLQGAATFRESCGGLHDVLGSLPLYPAYVANSSPQFNRVCGIPRCKRWGQDTDMSPHRESNVFIEWLDQGDSIDVVGRGLLFARHFWRCSGQGSTDQKPCDGPSRFLRVDGAGDCSTDKFSVMEKGTTIVRKEGNGTFSAHALATADGPIAVCRDGHYFEVRVCSLFRTSGLPERPRHHAPRSEGLVVGVTTTPPPELNKSAQRAQHAAPRTWCFSTGGILITSDCASRGHGARSALPVADVAAGCPTNEAGGRRSDHKKLAWAAVLDEGDYLGFLVTPFGGIVVSVNGKRQFLIPDVAVPSDVDLYPLVEVYSNIRSLQLVQRAAPPT